MKPTAIEDANRHPITGGRSVPTKSSPFSSDEWLAYWPWLGVETYPRSTLTTSKTIRGRFYTAQ